MQDKFQLAYDGQELLQGDINLIAADAAAADDVALQEVLHVAPYTGLTARGIVPYGYRKWAGTPPAATQQLITSVVGGFNVLPFRAVVGSRSSATGPAKYHDIRSALYINPNGSETTGVITLADGFSTGGPGYRIDMIYAKLWVDATITSRTALVKDPTTEAVNPVGSVVARTGCFVTLHAVTGPGGSTHAALPSDGVGYYVIPLAYVTIPDTYVSASSTIAQSSIIELFVSMNPRTTDVSPANSCTEATQTLFTYPNATVVAYASKCTPPKTRSMFYLPPSMNHIVTRFIPVRVGHSSGGDAASAGLPTDTVLDNSIDWRNRIFRINANVSQPNAGYNEFAWNGGLPAVPNFLDSRLYPVPTVISNSSVEGEVGLPGKRRIWTVDAGIVTYAWTGSEVVNLYVRSSDGALCLSWSGFASDTLTVNILFWLDATAPIPANLP